ncbi:gliding motility protein RemB [Flavobacteriaceae bacterium S356]|uniref:Gliding motility protein RemB n=1 Tax=Asprobacillus argus TaxID=3076534 RepID=A0ABU3LG09_9FLAO|nr:gliding motility protein RemB [Flavobacteriaceae bacterium S356]
MRKFLFLVFLLPSICFSQSEKFPVFDTCQGETITSVKDCFYKQTKELFFKEFKEPSIIEKEGFKGLVNAIFLVSNSGDFRLLYLNSPYEELKKEVERVFAKFPKIQPATYNNHAIEMQFILPLEFPLSDGSEKIEVVEKKEMPKLDIKEVVAKNVTPDSIFLEHQSQLNIPFTHQNYVDYEFALHKAKGTHTASKPYIYSEMSEYLDLTAQKKQFYKPGVKSWFGKKLWNEHLLQVKEDDYWFTLDFLFDVQFGKDNSDEVSYTYNNSRIFRINGGFGEKFSFSATIYESQGRFANYVNQFITNPSPNFKPAFSAGLVPGRGKAKAFKEDAFDYPVAEGYLSYTPSKYMQFQFGHGKNFIGDGYRSFILSDVATPSLYLKAKFSFWKFQYTNVWLWANDVRQAAVIGNEHARKYVAAHYLSINVSDRLNLGLFETAMSAGENGIDAGFLNPLIFYRSVEFNRGEDAGNAILGLTAKYKLSEKTSLYTQLIIDEFSVGNLGDLSDWRNKFAYQIGAKYFDAFRVENLFLQGEFNYARPYTFAHRNPVLNYGHYSQPLAHLWGANFWELVGIVRYKKDRWSGSAKLILGKKGFDFDQTVSYGGDIYQSYDIRVGDTGNELAQGNAATILIGEVQANYLLNPSNGLSLFAGFTFRNFSPETTSTTFQKETTTWFTVGLRADLFNWYLDF